jgi:transcriptional regulator with AAA-type ATPase domain
MESHFWRAIARTRCKRSTTIARDHGRRHRPDNRLVELAQRGADARERRRQEASDREWYATSPSFHGIIGRDKEWDRLRATWQAVSRAGRAVLIDRIGRRKSHFADDFARWVTAEGDGARGVASTCAAASRSAR